MRVLSKALVVVILLFIMTCCSGQNGVIEINKTKIGGLYEINENGKEYIFYNSDQSFKLDTLTYISFADFDKIQRLEPKYEEFYSLGFSLIESGSLKFKEMTQRNIGKQVCFVVGDKVMAAPIVQAVIPNGQGSITVGDEKSLEMVIEYLKN